MTELNNSISLKDFHSVLFEKDEISLSDLLLKRVNESFDFLKTFSANKIIYGVNTGFGPMAQYRISDEDTIQLQYNLIRSHSTGMGEELGEVYVRASVLARMNTLSLGHSGIHLSAIELMKELLNRHITPVIYHHGGVGASGDLVQLADLDLVLIGKGHVYYSGEKQLTKEIFESEGLEPLKVRLREGLAFMNGTSIMSGIGIVNVIYAERLFRWSVYCSGLINEIMRAYD